MQQLGPSVSSFSGIFFLSSVLFPNSLDFLAWLLDTGATHHVYCSFVSSVPTSNSSVTLPNGHLVSINRIGSIQLSPHITLINVLFVPQFQFNLLSVSALTQSHKYSTNFLSHSCLIQDHSQAKMIGIGRRHGNLYVLDFSSLVSQSFDMSTTCNNFSSSPIELWHYRLGHPSYAKIHTLKDDLIFLIFLRLHLIVQYVIWRSNVVYHLCLQTIYQILIFN